MMMRVVIPAKAGIQIKNTGFRIKSGMTKCVKFFLRQYTRPIETLTKRTNKDSPLCFLEDKSGNEYFLLIF